MAVGVLVDVGALDVVELLSGLGLAEVSFGLRGLWMFKVSGREHRN
jgi:hypothetical protein